MSKKDALNVTRLDDDSALQEIIDAVHEFNIFCDENDSCGDYECNAASMDEQEIETKTKVLEKAAKTVFKCWRSMLKDTLRTD